jgi:hypothetical protein
MEVKMDLAEACFKLGQLDERLTKVGKEMEKDIKDCKIINTGLKELSKRFKKWEAK